MDKVIIRRMYAAITAGDVPAVRRIIEDSPSVLDVEIAGESWLHLAANRDDVAVVEALVECGLDVNRPRRDDPETPLDNAASRGNVNVAKWLMDHGARVNVGGDGRGTILTAAVASGSADLVRLVLEHGPEVNAWFGNPPQNALSIAIQHGYTDIAEMLKGRGARMPNKTSAGDVREVLAHLERHVGEVLYSEVDQARGFHLVALRGDGVTVIATAGLSGRARSRDVGLELLMHLSQDWPLEVLKKDGPGSWPKEWLKIVADYSIEHDGSVGDGDVISNGDPPEPLGPNTEMCCTLLLEETGELGRLKTDSGEDISFCVAIPLYEEERDFLFANGAVALLEQFEKFGVRKAIDPKRVNVATAPYPS